MCRDIKFRAWDKEKKRLIQITDHDSIGILNNQFYEAMQYTGLKDNKGREIYEGDIFLHPDNPKYKYVVDWDEEMAAFNWFCQDVGFNHKEVEVIGNIYENPELLEG